MAIAIKIESLSKTYAVKAVDNLSLSIPVGRVYGLLGLKNAGKTTTLRLISGLSKPTSGCVENTASCSYYATIACEAVMNQLKLDTPRIILLDEQALDLEVRDKSALTAWEESLQEARERNKTVVLATNYIEVALHLCDQVALMNRGRLIAELTVTELRRLYNQQFYQIRIKGHIDASWFAWFKGLRLTCEVKGETVLAGTLPDQAALHGLLNKVRDLGLEILAVKRIEPDLRELLEYLMEREVI